ncbi:TPA: hypothetical protein DCZ39_06050 [Patescibacteria group bacterium]|nr:hypothetical protein [Candidatus Gracilibacteria bacterium]
MEVTAENAPKILKTDEFRDLKEEELVILLNAKRHENLLNKPNMTPTDKANMEKSIKFLIDKKMDTEENLKKLEAINYGSNYIEI